MKLNCDLGGESYGAWQMGQDDLVMPPLIDMANVACGFHAADPMVIRKTLALAAAHDVAVGAHPSYHDLPGFGRRSIHHTPEEIEALMLYQLGGALEGMCRSESLTLSYVKPPHGALNNDMMRDNRLLRAVMEAVRTFRTDLALMIPVTSNYREHQQMAADVGLPPLLLEAFADRAYDDEGQLVSRRQAAPYTRIRTSSFARQSRLLTKVVCSVPPATGLSFPQTACACMAIMMPHWRRSKPSARRSANPAND